MTSAAAMSVRVAAVPVVRAARAPSATVRGRSAVGMAIVRTARTVIVLRVIALRVTAPMPIVRVRKASGSGRGVISAIVRTSRVTARTVIVPKVIARVPSVIVRMVRRGATAHMVIVRTVTARRAIVRAPTAALAASAAVVVVAAVAALPSRL